MCACVCFLVFFFLFLLLSVQVSCGKRGREGLETLVLPGGLHGGRSRAAREGFQGTLQALTTASLFDFFERMPCALRPFNSHRSALSNFPKREGQGWCQHCPEQQR